MSDAGALYGRLEVRVADAEKQLARFKSNLDGNMKGLERRTKQAADTMSGSMKRAVQAMNQNLEGVGKGTNALTGQVGNLTAQLNDIGTQLAGGQSPFLIAIQQGSQISQVLGQAGARGAVSALGGAFASLVSPVNLATLAVIGIGGALVQYVTKGGSDINTLDESIKQHAALVARIKDSYGEAAAGLDAYVRESASVLKLQAEGAIKGATDALKTETKTLASSIGDTFDTVGVRAFGGARAFRGTEAFRVLKQAVADLTTSAETGEPKIREFRQRITDLAATDPTNEALQRLAVALLNSSENGLKAQDNLTNARNVIATLGDIASGQVNGVNDLNEALSKLAKIAVPALTIRDEADAAYKQAIGAATTPGARAAADAAYIAAVGRIENDEAGARVPIPGKKPSPLDEAPPSTPRARRERKRAASSFPAGGDATSGFVNDVVYRESGGKANAKNPNSSATGVGQFIESTWLDLFKRNFPDQAKGMTDGAILALRKDAAISRELIEKYAEENAAVLRAAGVSVDQAALQLSHFLGAGDAAKVLKAAPGTPLQGLISPQSIAANPSILGGGKTVDDARAYAESRVSGAGSFVASKEEAKQFKAELKEINAEAGQMENAVSSAVRGLVDDLIAGKSAGEAFANVLKKIGSTLLDQGIDSLVHSFFSGGGGGNLLSSLIGGFRATGGPVKAGVPYVVGEKRAEVFVPNQAGRILPDARSIVPTSLPQMRARSGGGPSTFKIEVSGARGNAEIEEAARRGAQQAIQQSRADLAAYDGRKKRTIGDDLSRWQARN